MGDESVNLQTNNLLGTGSRSPLLRLRREDKDSNNRRSGMIFDEDFQVTADQREADEELTKQVYSEVRQMESPKEESDGPKEDENRFIDKSPPPRPPPPQIERSNSESAGIPSIDKLEKEYGDIARFKIFQLAGDDAVGRPVIAFSACRLPVRDMIDHQRLLKFVKGTLDQYVENDYTIVYFHYGLSSQNKPSFSWLLQVYHELDRKYKKNIKALYIVHPSNFIKVMYHIMSPFLSKKFGRKIHYFNRLDDLTPYIRMSQLDIPKEVRNHDDRVMAKSKPKAPGAGSSFHVKLEVPKTQQFGIPLNNEEPLSVLTVFTLLYHELMFLVQGVPGKRLKENNSGDPIPTVIKTCVAYLRENGLETEGIFRRSPLSSSLQEYTKRFNAGEDVQFEDEDVHAPAVLIKKFLREVPEPLLTFELYDQTMDICSLSEEERVIEIKKMFKEKLPEENYILLKYICDFLNEVVDNSSKNKMTTQNLAIIFGPNLMWSEVATTSLTSMSKINTFARVLFDHSKEIFDD